MVAKEWRDASGNMVVGGTEQVVVVVEVSAEGKVVVVEVIVAVGREVPSINSIAMFGIRI